MRVHAAQVRSAAAPVAVARSPRAHPAVRAILRGPAIQPKLTTGAVDDPTEREADRVADEVMRMPEPAADAAGDAQAPANPLAPPSGSATSPVVNRKCATCAAEEEQVGGIGPPAVAIWLSSDPAGIQRLCATCEDEREAPLERRATDLTEPDVAPPAVHEVFRAPGRPLDAATRAFMEPRFGHDFSNVRIHEGPSADAAAASINARAFTLGDDITFAGGEYTLGTADGRRLLTHELTHTLQQRDALGRLIQRQTTGTKGTKKKGKGKSSAQSQSKAKVSTVKAYFITVTVEKDIKYYKIADLYNNFQIVAHGQFHDSQIEQELNVSEKVGKEARGKYYVGLFCDDGMPIKAHVPLIRLTGEKEVIIRTVSKLTMLRETYKNYDELKARMDELEKQPQFKGKIYLRVIRKGDTIDHFAKTTVADNSTSYARLSKKLPELNQGINAGVIGNGIILLQSWIDPNIGVMPEKPNAATLTDDQKDLIATCYGEVHGASFPGTAEQLKYILYSMILRVKSPDFLSDLYAAALRSGAYQAFGANQYTRARKQLDENKPGADLIQVRDTVLGSWNDEPPTDAGIQYAHYSSLSTDRIKISDYYEGAVDDVKENEAAYKYLVAQKWDTKGFSATKGWKKRIRLTEGKLEGTMYVFN